MILQCCGGKGPFCRFDTVSRYKYSARDMPSTTPDRALRGEESPPPLSSSDNVSATPLVSVSAEEEVSNVQDAEDASDDGVGGGRRSSSPRARSGSRKVGDKAGAGSSCLSSNVFVRVAKEYALATAGASVPSPPPLPIEEEDPRSFGPTR